MTSINGVFACTDDHYHVLVFPYPALGHMIPLLDFCHHLISSKHALIKITILVTPKNLHLLHPLISSHPCSIEPLVLPLPSHPSIPSAVENVKDLTPSSFRAMMVTLGQLHDPLLQWFQSHPTPPVVIVSDMFLGWTHRLACKLGIRRVLFSPSGAMALSVIFSLWNTLPTLKDPDDRHEVVSFADVPNSPKYPWWQLSPIYRSYVEGEPGWEFIRDSFKANMGSWGVAVNSFDRLERVYLDHLREFMGHDRVWAVGPLLPPEDDKTGWGPGERGGSSSIPTEEVLRWLEAREDNKVVYVCFGSQAVLKHKQIDAIASGLERSGVHFIWAVKEDPTAATSSIPSEFEDRVAGRGLVIRGWAPQVLILKHRAVGAFLTHCGWNSVVEALVSGVVMLAWPMGADQFTNATLLVEELRVARRVCEGAETVPDVAELGRVVAELARSTRTRDRKWVERERVAELRTAAFECLKGGGSSAGNWESFISALNALKFEDN